MRAAWDDAIMDCLLLVCPLERCVGFDGQGDFSIDAKGALVRKRADDAIILSSILAAILFIRASLRVRQLAHSR